MAATHVFPLAIEPGVLEQKFFLKSLVFYTVGQKTDRSPECGSIVWQTRDPRLTVYLVSTNKRKSGTESKS